MNIIGKVVTNGPITGEVVAVETRGRDRLIFVKYLAIQGQETSFSRNAINQGWTFGLSADRFHKLFRIVRKGAIAS